MSIIQAVGAQVYPDEHLLIPVDDPLGISFQVEHLLIPIDDPLGTSFDDTPMLMPVDDPLGVSFASTTSGKNLVMHQFKPTNYLSNKNIRLVYISLIYFYISIKSLHVIKYI